MVFSSFRDGIHWRSPKPAPDEHVDSDHHQREPDGQRDRGGGGVEQVGGLPAEENAQAEQDGRPDGAGDADEGDEPAVRDAGEPGSDVRRDGREVDRLRAGHHPRQVVLHRGGEPDTAALGQPQPAQQPPDPRPVAETAE
jgi:hypothetical protein